MFARLCARVRFGLMQISNIYTPHTRNRLFARLAVWLRFTKPAHPDTRAGRFVCVCIVCVCGEASLETFTKHSVSNTDRVQLVVSFRSTHDKPRAKERFWYLCAQSEFLVLPHRNAFAAGLCNSLLECVICFDKCVYECGVHSWGLWHARSHQKSPIYVCVCIMCVWGLSWITNHNIIISSAL